MGEEFCFLIRVRYSECDAQKVVFNSRYGDYLDAAVTEFMRVIWGNYNDILADGIDNQVVSYAINWKASAQYDDILAITVKTKLIGNTSYTLQVDFYNYEDSSCIASSEIVYVMVSVEEHRKLKIPQAMRDKLEKGASGVTIDHAGVGIDK